MSLNINYYPGIMAPHNKVVMQSIMEGNVVLNRVPRYYTL